ncbi:MAG: helix-turn-helix domain-containing protein [bacterium]|nr:helix-turn-helix domain-containing protein [bacterium]
MAGSTSKLLNKRALSISEAAALACVGRSTMENWLAQGLIPFEELPGQGKGRKKFRRIRKSDLDSFLDFYYREPPIIKEIKKMEGEILLPYYKEA